MLGGLKGEGLAAAALGGQGRSPARCPLGAGSGTQLEGLSGLAQGFGVAGFVLLQLVLDDHLHHSIHVTLRFALSCAPVLVKPASLPVQLALLCGRPLEWWRHCMGKHFGSSGVCTVQAGNEPTFTPTAP